MSGAEPGIEPGTVIANKYRVDRVIGKGGMGVVVAATQLALDRMVAIKLVRTDCAVEPMAVERLLREAKAAASIKSEHVARVLDVGTLEDGAPFIVMEYLEGSDLQSLVDRDGALPAADAVDILLEACEALAEAHRNGIVHRDVKPANLFLARLPGGASTLKVVDFGISKLMRPDPAPSLTLPATIVGSLYHMAPEQMRGAAVDARTDVWALGLVLFELLTGRRPFVDQAWPAVCARVLHGSAPLIEGPVAGVNDELLAIIGKCLRRQPQDRFANVAELAVALNRFGTRRGHASLERIVLLATSTGSLAAADALAAPPRMGTLDALAGTRPADTLGGTRPVAAPAASPTAATPMPLSSAPALEAPSRALRLARVGALLALVGTVVWLVPRSRPAQREQIAPLQPAAPAAAPQPLTAEETRPREPVVAPLVTPERAESPAAAPKPAPAPSAPAASANGPAATAAPSSAARATASRAPSDAPGTGGSSGASRANAGEAAAGAGGGAPTPEAAPPAPSAPAPKPVRTPSPWDLNDIEFRSDDRR